MGQESKKASAPTNKNVRNQEYYLSLKGGSCQWQPKLSMELHLNKRNILFTKTENIRCAL